MGYVSSLEGTKIGNKNIGRTKILGNYPAMDENWGTKKNKKIGLNVVILEVFKQQSIFGDNIFLTCSHMFPQPYVFR